MEECKCFPHRPYNLPAFAETAAPQTIVFYLPSTFAAITLAAVAIFKRSARRVFTLYRLTAMPVNSISKSTILFGFMASKSGTKPLELRRGCYGIVTPVWAAHRPVPAVPVAAADGKNPARSAGSRLPAPPTASYSPRVGQWPHPLPGLLFATCPRST